MRFFVFSILAAFFTLSTSFGQETFKRNTVFGELAGSSFLVSINFDNVIPFWPYLSFGYSF